jgi:hypothetical protein
MCLLPVEFRFPAEGRHPWTLRKAAGPAPFVHRHRDPPADYTRKESEQIIVIGPPVDHMLGDLFDKTHGQAPV